jgi:putative membrane protein
MENRLEKTEQPKLDTATRLAIERTRVAYERTIMSAVRTSTSLITFGFSAYKFFQMDLSNIGGAGQLRGTAVIGPKQFGIAMIALGLVSLTLAWYEYQRDTRTLRQEYPAMPRSTAGVIAALVAILGSSLLVIAWLNG